MAFTLARRRKLYMGLVLFSAFLTASVASEFDCINCEGGASGPMDLSAPLVASSLTFGTDIAHRVDGTYFGREVSLNTGFYADPTADFFRNLSAYAAPPLENPAFQAWDKYLATAAIFSGTPFAAGFAPTAWSPPTLYSVLPQ